MTWSGKAVSLITSYQEGRKEGRKEGREGRREDGREGRRERKSLLDIRRQSESEVLVLDYIYN